MRGFTVLAVLVVAIGVCHAQSFMSWTYEDKASDEEGQFAGPKRTNCSCGITNKSQGRIVGGRLTKPLEYPHMVGIAKSTPSGGLGLFCGGTILTKHHVITAAHCTVDLNSYDRLAVMVGGHDTQNPTRHMRIYDVVQHIEHEYYNAKSYVNDIAMLLIAKPIEFSEYVGPACLPTSPMNSMLVGGYVKVTGWGNTAFKGSSAQTLLKVNLRVVPLNECSAKYGGSISTTVPTQFCTFRPSKDSCQGDSGGPVTWLDPETNRFVLVGLVSFGEGCATPKPGVNTDVYAFLPWIQDIINRSAPNVRTCAKLG